MADHEIRIPDIEIIVGAAGDDVAVFCFYKREDIHQGYDIACALTHEDARPVVRQILQDAVTAINTADWVTMDVLREEPISGEGEAPF